MGSYDDQNERWAQQRLGQSGQNIPTVDGQKGYSDYLKNQGGGGGGGGGGSCFASSTPILIPTGWVPIGSLHRGDDIVTFDVTESALRIRPLTRRIDHAPAAVWRIRSERNTLGVGTTHCHPFLTARGWIRARKLRVGDRLTAVDETGAVFRDSVTEIEPSHSFETVHNLLTFREHTFIAAGFVAHNFAYFRRVRSLLHRVLGGPCHTRNWQCATTIRSACESKVNS